VLDDLDFLAHRDVEALEQVARGDVLLDAMAAPVDALFTASRSVLLGMVPVWAVTPPTISRRSMTAARLPSLAAWMAAR
jgi:hypothetical protein